jgi:MarR family transcriptional regulator for hemolysin
LGFDPWIAAHFGVAKATKMGIAHMTPSTFTSTLVALARIIQTTGSENLTCVGLGNGQVKVLFAVIRTPGIQQSALCLNLSLNKSVISRAVKILVKAGYLKRKLQPGKSKARGLVPTRMALALGNYMESCLDDLENRLTEGFSPQERTDFLEYIQRAQANLQRPPQGLIPQLKNGNQPAEPLPGDATLVEFLPMDFVPVDF